MATGLFNWKRTPADNANRTYNWAEGMSPSSVNDSARGDKSDVAQWRDDISGAIVTTGTSTAYAVTSYSAFDTLANMHGQMIGFTPHVANGATVTLNVDGLGAKALRTAPGVELQSNVLMAGTPYFATYSNTDSAWYLHGLGGNTYGVPLLGGMDYWDTVTPSSAFIFPTGQALSRTTYAAAFARWGTTFGAGDGSTTFNAPDKTERVSVMKSSVASRLTASYFGGNSTLLGAVGGSESHTLGVSQVPNLNVSASGNAGNFQVDGSATNFQYLSAAAGGAGFGGGGQAVRNGTQATASVNVTGATTNGGGGAHNNVQPTIVCNYIIRVL